MKNIVPLLIFVSFLSACGSGTTNRYLDGTQGMGRDSIRLELRPDGQYTIVTWEGYSSAGTYVETGKSIIFTQPHGGQESGTWQDDGSLKIDGHRLVAVDADKPMPKR